MGIRSLNNPNARFIAKFSTTGTDAVTPAPTPPGDPGGPYAATGGSAWSYPIGDGEGYRIHAFTSSANFCIRDFL